MNSNDNSLDDQRSQLREEHSRQLRTISERYGRQINNIVHKLDEPDFIKTHRTELCNQKFFDAMSLTMGVQDREKLKLEVELKRQWDKEHSNKGFDTTYADSILRMRQDRYATEQNDPDADQDFARHQVEFDKVVKDYLDGQTSYEQFVRNHDRTVTQQMLEGVEDYETETQEKNVNKDQDRDKAPDIET